MKIKHLDYVWAGHGELLNPSVLSALSIKISYFCMLNSALALANRKINTSAMN